MWWKRFALKYNAEKGSHVSMRYCTITKRNGKFFLPVRMSKKCKWKKKSNSFSKRCDVKTNEDEDDDSLKILLLKLFFFFLYFVVCLSTVVLLFFTSFICCLMASDQTGDWIISLTLRLKKAAGEEEEKNLCLVEITDRIQEIFRVIEMKEGTEIIEIYILLPIFSLHCCFLMPHSYSFVFEVKMINNFFFFLSLIYY